MGARNHAPAAPVESSPAGRGVTAGNGIWEAPASIEQRRCGFPLTRSAIRGWPLNGRHAWPCSRGPAPRSPPIGRASGRPRADQVARARPSSAAWATPPGLRSPRPGGHTAYAYAGPGTTGGWTSCAPVGGRDPDRCRGRTSPAGLRAACTPSRRRPTRSVRRTRPPSAPSSCRTATRPADALAADRHAGFPRWDQRPSATRPTRRRNRRLSGDRVGSAPARPSQVPCGQYGTRSTMRQRWSSAARWPAGRPPCGAAAW